MSRRGPARTLASTVGATLFRRIGSEASRILRDRGNRPEPADLDSERARLRIPRPMWRTITADTADTFALTKREAREAVFCAWCLQDVADVRAGRNYADA